MSLHGVTRKDSARRARVRQGGAIRRARERSAPGRITKAVRRAVWDTAAGRCYLCKLPVPFEKMHVEHELALANVGTNDPENLRCSCAGCNLRKGARATPRRKGLRRTTLRAKPKSKIPRDADVF